MDQTLPKQLVFSCEAGAFLVYDSEEAKNFLRYGNGVPFLAFKVGPGNIFEASPKRVLQHTSSVVSVQCADGVIVHLDLDEETAQKETPQGKYLFCGGLTEGNSGQGYIKA